MKVVVNIARVLVGGLFIFSGLIKAIDPLGLSYKMQEFFEVWATSDFMKTLLMSLSQPFSKLIITLEVILGFALLIGWSKKLVSWLLLLLTIFFTFLTAFVLFTGKIRACGCFGDCIPLTPVQTFCKDLALLLLIFFIILGRKHIQPLFKKGIWRLSLILIALFGVLFLQDYVLRHLPLKDCLPFKAGNNILELRKMPKDAVQDKYVMTFLYEKNGVIKEFKTDGLPDSSWTFKDRKQTLIEKGRNNTPLINDFSFTTESGNDTTEDILSQAGEYYLLFIRDEKSYPKNWDLDTKMIQEAFAQKKPIYIISSQREFARARFINKIPNGGLMKNPEIFTCDYVAIKTAARNNPVLYAMKGPVIQEKWAWTDFNKLIRNK